MGIVGRVREIWRYPVKSMAGQRLEWTPVEAGGVLGDRGWALRNDEAGEIQGGKKFPRLMACEARYRVEPSRGHIPAVEIRFPDGTRISSDSPHLSARLTSDLTGGVRASLQPLPPADVLEAAHRRGCGMDASRFALELTKMSCRGSYPDLLRLPAEILDYTSRPGMHFDLAPLHLLTTASLHFMQSRNPEAVWDVRRFRPNFLIQPEDGGAEGLAEAGWLGKTLRIGSLSLHCMGATPRCAMVTRPQPGLPFDASVLRSIVEDAGQNLGAYAVVAFAGEVREGDTVELLAT